MAPSEENSVPITIVIQFDDHPGEISWSIGYGQSEIVLVNVTEELNTVARSKSQKTVSFIFDRSFLLLFGQLMLKYTRKPSLK